MNVLAGRKTGGVIEGNTYISGYPKRQDSFARISGYCEQTDVHFPCLIVWESLLFSAWLQLYSDVDFEMQKVVEWVPKIKSGYNPTTWMLEVTSSTEENCLRVDFAEIY
ncbi:hypothetical protein AHAS_Ahas07G0098300 [Arachis hypogaea]